MSSPYKFSVSVHGDGGFVPSHFDEDGPVVVSHRDRVGPLERLHAPNALHVVIERILEAVRVSVPDAQRPVLRPRQNYRQLGVVRHSRHILSMA